MVRFQQFVSMVTHIHHFQKKPTDKETVEAAAMDVFGKSSMTKEFVLISFDIIVANPPAQLWLVSCVSCGYQQRHRASPVQAVAQLAIGVLREMQIYIRASLSVSSERRLGLS
jgi:hypothetical protein